MASFGLDTRIKRVSKFGADQLRFFILYCKLRCWVFDTADRRKNDVGITNSNMQPKFLEKFGFSIPKQPRLTDKIVASIILVLKIWICNPNFRRNFDFYTWILGIESEDDMIVGKIIFILYILIFNLNSRRKFDFWRPIKDWNFAAVISTGFIWVYV